MDTSGALHEVWSGTDPGTPGMIENFTAAWATTNYLVAGLKIYVNNNYDPTEYKEIDSVQLLGASLIQSSGATTLAGGTIAGDCSTARWQFGRCGDRHRPNYNAGKVAAGGPLATERSRE